MAHAVLIQVPLRCGSLHLRLAGGKSPSEVIPVVAEFGQVLADGVLAWCGGIGQDEVSLVQHLLQLVVTLITTA